MTILLEDRTLLKLLQYFGSGQGSENALKSEDFDIYNSQRFVKCPQISHFQLTGWPN